MRFLFVMDPVEKMIPDKDTSFAFIRGAESRGHECLHCLPRDLYNIGRDVFSKVRQVSVFGHGALGDGRRGVVGGSCRSSMRCSSERIRRLTEPTVISRASSTW